MAWSRSGVPCLVPAGGPGDCVARCPDPIWWPAVGTVPGAACRARGRGRKGYERIEPVLIRALATGRRDRTILSISPAADLGSSCSQTTMTNQPAAESCLSVSASRRTLASNFVLHQVRFSRGTVPCMGHWCQKQPLTSMATRLGPKTMSVRRRDCGNRFRSTRYRSPRR